MKIIYRLIKINRLIASHRLKYLTIWIVHIIGMRHLFLRLDPVLACNLSCRMCYFSNDEYRRKNKGSFSLEELERISKLFYPKTLQLIVGCGTEPTLHKEYIGIIQAAKNKRVPFVGLTTNGQLLMEKQIKELIDIGLDELTLSIHGVRQETYESFMTNATFERLINMLESLEYLRKRNTASRLKLRINYTVNADNLDELMEFFSVFGKYRIDTLQIRPVMDIGGQYRTVLQEKEFLKYKRTLETLSSECRKRNITLLANYADPSYVQDGYSSVVLPAIKRYISPQIVWKEDFNWKTETYKQFCRRINWGTQLFLKIFTSRGTILMQNKHNYAARYDVLM